MRGLAENDGEGDDRGERIMADQARDFRMCRQNGAAALRMRPHRLRDKKVMRARLVGRSTRMSRTAMFMRRSSRLRDPDDRSPANS